MTPRSRSLIVAALGLVGCVGCADAATPPLQRVSDDGKAYVPATVWRNAPPAAVGLDASRIETLKANVASGRYGSIQGLVVVRFGYLAVEQYVGWSRDQAHTMQSVTKSITSLLYGIQSAGGTSTADALDRPVTDMFTRYAPVANLDDRKRALTLRHLLTMRSNMDFWEQPYPGSPLDQLNRSTGDWTKFILDRPMTDAPGTSWAYNSGAAILMCAALREVSAEKPDVFARRELFGPIGVSGESWITSSFDGLPHCGGGLYLKPIDLARVGYLVLRRGRWGSRQIVPAGWIDSSTHAVTSGAPVFYSSFGAGYGYFWWLFPTARGASNEGIIAAAGSGGQWLFVVPSLDLVVVVVATNGNGLDLLYGELLPAISPE